MNLETKKEKGKIKGRGGTEKVNVLAKQKRKGEREEREMVEAGKEEKEKKEEERNSDVGH